MRACRYNVYGEGEKKTNRNFLYFFERLVVAMKKEGRMIEVTQDGKVAVNHPVYSIIPLEIQTRYFEYLLNI